MKMQSGLLFGIMVVLVLGMASSAFAQGMHGEASIGVNTSLNKDTNMTVEVENETVVPPKVKRPVDVCARYIVNITRARRIMKKQFRMEVGKRLDQMRAEAILAGMNKTISLGEEFGANVSQLIDLRNEFASVLSELNASSGDEYKQNARLLMKIVIEFRQAAHQIPELQNHTSEVREAVKETMEDVKKEKEKLKEELIQKAKEIGLAVFDLHVCRAEEKLNRFYNLGFNVSKAEEILNEIKGMRSELAVAYDSGNRTEVVRVKVEIAKKWGEFHRAFIRLNARVMRHQFWKAKEKIRRAIRRIKENGGNTSKLEERLQELEEMSKRMNNETQLRQFAQGFSQLNMEIKSKIRARLPIRPSPNTKPPKGGHR